MKRIIKPTKSQVRQSISFFNPGETPTTQTTMSDFKLAGRLIGKGELKQVTEKLTVRDFTIETKEEYPQKVTFQLKNAKTSLLKGLGSGDELTVYFNVDGREWNGKYFNTLVCWKVETLTPKPDTLPKIERPTDDDFSF